MNDLLSEAYRVRHFEVNICEGCLRLEGQQCHTPGCCFCFSSTEEVGEYLDILLIRPIVNGVRMDGWLNEIEELSSKEVEEIKLITEM